jgi:hypothetical protein
MDPASPARLRAIIDRLLASTYIGPADRRSLEEMREILEPPPRPASVTVRHEPYTVPDPAIVTLRMPEARR